MSNEDKSNTTSTVVSVVSIGTFLALIILGILVLTKSYSVYGEAKTNLQSTYTIIQQGYSTALSYFALAFGALLLGILLPRLQSISLPGGIGVTLKQSLSDIMQQQNAIQAALAGVGGQKSIAVKNKVSGKAQIRSENQPRQIEKNGRRLTVEVEALESESDFFKAKILVESIDLFTPLLGLVRFHLSPNFINPNPLIAVQDGKAILSLAKVQEAFQVIAITDEGRTELKLDVDADNV